MDADTVITVLGGEFIGTALGGNIALGQINATNVAMDATGNISDANGATLNVDGTTLSLRARGMIGAHDNTNGTPDININAIDTRVTTLAAEAGSGIYILEANELIIDTVAAVTVNLVLGTTQPVRVNLNSTTTNVSDLQPLSRTIASLEDLSVTCGLSFGYSR